MITTHKNNLIARCKQRGYELKNVMACVLKQNGDIWTIDETHEAYPKKITEEPTQSKDIDIGQGAGTELKKLLKLIGITSSPTCGCNAKAKYMNEKGIQWCKDNVDTIAEWLKEEADKRKLPFINFVVKKIIKLAISRAEKLNVQTS